jgi:hypothetical protein
MSASAYTGTMTSLEVKVSIPCELFSLPVTLLNNLSYLEPKKISAGALEIATCEFAEQLFILNAKVEDAKVTGISVTGFGNDILCHKNPFWGPVVKQAWKQEGVNIDKLESTPVSVENFINNLLEKPGSKAMDHCFIMVRVLDFGELGVLVCFYVCGHWVQCVHLAPKP